MGTPSSRNLISEFHLEIDPLICWPGDRVLDITSHRVPSDGICFEYLRQESVRGLEATSGRACARQRKQPRIYR